MRFCCLVVFRKKNFRLVTKQFKWKNPAILVGIGAKLGSKIKKHLRGSTQPQTIIHPLHMNGHYTDCSLGQYNYNNSLGEYCVLSTASCTSYSMEASWFLTLTYLFSRKY